MRFVRPTFVIVLFVCGVLCGCTAAQEIIPTDKLQPSDCSQDLYDRAENEYRRAVSYDSNATVRAEKLISRILAICPSEDINFNMRSELEELREKQAEHFLLIAGYYVDQFEKNGRGLKGGQSRLIEITTKYPHYSKLDEVLLLLAKTYALDDDLEDAESSLKKLIHDFPNTSTLVNAQIELQTIQLNRHLQKIVEGQ